MEIFSGRGLTFQSIPRSCGAFKSVRLVSFIFSMFIDFRERGRKRVGVERGRETETLRVPDQDSNPQPFGVRDNTAST